MNFDKNFHDKIHQNFNLQQPAASSGRTQLWMGDVIPSMDEEYVKNVWLKFGEHVGVKLVRDIARNNGYAFVDFGFYF